MSDNAKIKKIDDETLHKLKEGTGPVDECMCSMFYEPEKGGIRHSIKKAFASISGNKRKNGPRDITFPQATASKTTRGKKDGNFSVDIPITFKKTGKGIFSTKEVMRREKRCGKCPCDNKDFVLRHSYANIRISTPDISNLCPCPSNCASGKHLSDSLKVSIE